MRILHELKTESRPQIPACRYLLTATVQPHVLDVVARTHCPSHGEQVTHLAEVHFAWSPTPRLRVGTPLCVGVVEDVLRLVREWTARRALMN